MAKILSVERVGLALTKSNPPSLIISAFGTTSTPNWTDLQLQPLWNRTHPPKNGVYEFAFTGNPPAGNVIQIIDNVGPVSYTLSPVETMDCKKVIIHAATNCLTEERDVDNSVEPNPDTETPGTATGYSDKWDLGEAFKDAIANLPKDNNPFPDKLYRYTITEIGAEIGGIAGFNRMKVTIKE